MSEELFYEKVGWYIYKSGVATNSEAKRRAFNVRLLGLLKLSLSKIGKRRMADAQVDVATSIGVPWWTR